MRILLISGHGAGDPGVVANGFKEADLTVEVVNKLALLLKSYVEVTVYPVERNAFQDVQNRLWQVGWNFDYVLEVHFNAGGGTGSEIFVTTRETRTAVEQTILKSMEFFYCNRGVKVTDFLVINTAKNRGISSALLEVCFVDSASDVNVYQNNKDAICKSIVNGIISGFGMNTANPVEPVPSLVTKTIDQIAQEVIAGQWGINPERQQRLISAGHDANAVQAKVNQILSQDNTTQAKFQYYPAFNSNSIVDGLKSINVDSSVRYRNKIAIANGITNYSGTAQQNTMLLDLARQGKLLGEITDK
jgi:hypothetical protein